MCHPITLSCLKRPPGLARMPEFDAACLIKHYSVNGTRLGHVFGLAKIGAPGRGDVGNV